MCVEWCKPSCVDAPYVNLRTREYDFKSFIKRYVSGSTLGRLHNTMGIYIHGSGHKLSMWYHVVLGHSAESLLVLITLRGRRFEPFARRQRIYLSFVNTDIRRGDSAAMVRCDVDARLI